MELTCFAMKQIFLKLYANLYHVSNTQGAVGNLAPKISKYM